MSTQIPDKTNTKLEKRRNKKSLIHKLIKLCALFLGQSVTLYALLKVSKIILSKLNLPYQNAQICALSFLYAYITNKSFNFFRYEWTLMLLTKSISDLIVNKIPKNKRLSKTNTYIIFGVIFLYFAVYHNEYASKSYSYFANTCYFNGEIKEYHKNAAKYYHTLSKNPQTANWRDINKAGKNRTELEFLLNRAIFFGKHVFKWYIQFYLGIQLIFTLKRYKSKALSMGNIYQIIQKSLKSSLASTWNNAFLCVMTFYALPCITGTVCDKSGFSINKHKAIVFLLYLPIIQRISLQFEPASRYSKITIFFIAESIKWAVNMYQDIDLISYYDGDIKGRQENVMKKNKDLMFGMYVFLQMALYAQSTEKSQGIISKMMQSIMT